MSITSGKAGFAAKAAMVATAAAACVAMVSTPAQALGNNRNVSRTCGVNWVASGATSATSAWAQTKRVSGTCQGILSVSLQANNGYVFARVYGSRTSAYISRTHSTGFSRGLHRGCNECGVTYS